MTNDIERLVHRLGAALDEGRFEELHDLFTEDATASTPGGRAQGRDAVVAQASRNHDPAMGIQHVISGVLVDGDGDRRSVRANLVVHFARGGTPVFTMGEVYRFEAVRTDDGWRLASVATTPIWSRGIRP